MAYPPADSKPDFPGLEAAVLDHWERDGTFQASVEQRPAELLQSGERQLSVGLHANRARDPAAR